MTNNKWYYSLFAKTAAIFLLTLLCAGIFVSVVGAVCAWDYGMYSRTEQTAKAEMLSGLAYSDARQAAFDILHGDGGFAQQLADRQKIGRAHV